jgi:hypothetical protein
MGCFEGNNARVAQPGGPGEPVLACWGGSRTRLCFGLFYARQLSRVRARFPASNVASSLMPPMPRYSAFRSKQVSGHEFTRAVQPS